MAIGVVDPEWLYKGIRDITEEHEVFTVFKTAIDDIEDGKKTGTIINNLNTALKMWKRTEEGHWVYENAIDFDVHHAKDYALLQTLVTVRAAFPPKNATIYRLRWLNTED